MKYIKYSLILIIVIFISNCFGTEQSVSDKFLYISSNEDTEFLDLQLKKIFPNGYSKFNDEYKAIEILRFISSYLKLKQNTGTATEILKDQIAFCGGMALSFKILTRRVNLPSRYIGTFNLPHMSNHAAVEVYYNNSWHYFDPTFGIFFYSKKDYDGNGNVVSFKKLTSFPDKYSPIKVVENPWKGYYSTSIKQFGMQGVGPSYMKYHYKKSLLEIYKANLNKNFPVAFSTGKSISMPVDVDLENRQLYEIGKKDKKHSDLSNMSKRYAGFYYLSNGPGIPYYHKPYCYHTWFVKTKENKYLELEYSFISGNGNIVVEPLKGLIVVDTLQEKNKFKLVFRTVDNEIAFKVYVKMGTWNIDYMNIKYIAG